jgi:hypothetical protein
MAMEAFSGPKSSPIGHDDLARVWLTLIDDTLNFLLSAPAGQVSFDYSTLFSVSRSFGKYRNV